MFNFNWNNRDQIWDLLIFSWCLVLKHVQLNWNCIERERGRERGWFPLLHREQQRCLWVNRQGESDNSSNKHQSQPSFSLLEEVKLEQVLTGDGGMRYYTPALILCMPLSRFTNLLLSLSFPHILSFDFSQTTKVLQRFVKISFRGLQRILYVGYGL